MTYARKSLISLQDTPFYHVVSRCVRRAWLWGLDEYAGKDYSHRKQWVTDRIAHLSRVFAIDVCAYAVMSNHYHLVLRVDQNQAREWTVSDVVERWTLLFKRPVIVERYQQEVASEAERQEAEQLIETWRMRLCDISWFMRCLNEYLARRANAEEECKGRFWEGRYRSQALLDEVGLLTAMSYVDLNPIRANAATTPETSEYTSIYQRIREHRQAEDSKRPSNAIHAGDGVKLLRFRDESVDQQAAISFHRQDYLELVDWTGRVIRNDKRGSIDTRLPAIMHRLNVDADAWQIAMRPAGNVFGRALGRIDHLRLHAKTLGQSWIRGARASERLYVS